MPKVPESIGKYKITGRLGKGGMSILYLAEHPSLGTTVVLKKLTLKGDPAHRERFRREATLMMKLRHENVVGVYDHFKEGSSHYLVMEFVDGRPLSELMAREGALPDREAWWLAGRIAAALAHIHSQGIVHRDLKPSNVLLGRDGSVKLGDFGIAFTPGGDDDITSEGTALGTPTFMAPEQLEDARMADERSDMWSFGVCLFEMLTGRKFVTGPSPAAIREALPDAVRTMHQRLPPKLLRRLRRILRRTIRMKPDSRMKDGQAVLRLLRTARQAKNPPENLKERLQKLLASMDSVPDPTPEAEPAGNQDSRSFNLQSMFKLPRIIKPEDVTKRKISLSGFQRITASLLIFFVLCLMILIILPGAWNSAFRRNSFGSFRLRLTFPRETAESWLTGAETCIYREADGFLREVKTPLMKLSGSGLSMDSRRMTLAVGAYRLRWSLGDRVSWYSFYLPSIRENRESGIGILILEETLGDPPIFPLVFSWSVTDALSGGNLTGQTSMVWERLDKPGEILLSGGVYQFQFDAQGFQREVFDIAISPWRRNLSLHASLWPQPGSLTIQNNSGRLIMPRLDGSGQYLDMESSPRRHFIGRLKTGTSKKLILLPGRYLLTPGMGKSVVQDISVKNNENLTVIIESNEEKQLLIRVSPEE